MSSAAPEPAPAPDPARTQALLAQCWQIVSDVYLPRVAAIFTEALALAARSGDELQERAAAALSLQEKALVRAYATELRGGFDEGVAVFQGRKPAPAPSAAALSLMAMDESDLRSQIDQVAARLRNRVTASQAALSLRLQAMRPAGAYLESTSPLRAAIFLDAVADAFESVAPSVAGMGAVLRHFPAAMAPAVDACFEAISRYLDSQGIVPVAVSRPPPGARTGAAARVAPPAGAAPAAPAAPAAGPERLSLDGAPPVRAGAASDDAPRVPAGRGAPTRLAPAPPEPDADGSADEIALAEYGRLQATLGINASPLIDAIRDAARRPAGAPPAALAPAAPALVAAMLSAQRHDAARVAARSAVEGETARPGAPADGAKAVSVAAPPEFVGSREHSRRLITLGGNPLQRLTLQLVARIFTRIERDRLVPPAVRSLLVALRFPFLELALVDPAVLLRPDHPARRLINAIATSSIGWAPDGADNQRYLRHARSAVHFVVHSPGSADSAFAQACDQFEAFLEAIVPAASLSLVAARDALRDAEKRAAHAAEAAAYLEQILEGDGVDDYLRQFILGPWAHVLAEAAAGEAREPGVFHRRLMVIPELIGSVRPAATAAERKRQVEAIAPLLAHLREGVARIGWPADKMEVFLDRLMVAHSHILGGGDPAAPGTGAFSASTIRIRLDGFALREVPEIDPQSPLPVMDEAVQIQLARVPSKAVHQWFKAPPRIPDGAPDADTARAQVAQWRDRLWFDIRIGKTLVRMRLVAWTPARSLALFSSRNGNSLVSFSRDTLAGFLRCGLIAPAEGAPLLTRALRSVLKDLGRTAQAAAANADGA
jgi:hypothetical protein